MDSAYVPAIFFATTQRASARRPGRAHGHTKSLQKAQDAHAETGGTDRQRLASVLQLCCMVPLAEPGIAKRRVHHGGTEARRKDCPEVSSEAKDSCRNQTQGGRSALICTFSHVFVESGSLLRDIRFSHCVSGMQGVSPWQV